jgi:hypothetical protein
MLTSGPGLEGHLKRLPSQTARGFPEEIRYVNLRFDREPIESWLDRPGRFVVQTC